MSGHTIRPLAKHDIGFFLNLVKELAESQKALDKVSATEEGLHDCFFGKRPGAQAALAEVSGEVAGFAVFFLTNSTYKAKPCFFLEDLYVRPHYRGKGIGKALFMHAVRLAHEYGCIRVDWLAMDWNKAAIDFYLALGAIVRDDVRPYRLEYPAIEALIAKG